MKCKHALILRTSAPLVLLFAAGSARADFVEIEKMLETPAENLARKLEGAKVVVAVRNGVAENKPWNIGQAASVELTAALRRVKIDAIRAAADTRFQKLEATDRPFTDVQAKALPQAGRQVLVGIEWLAGKQPRLKITAFAADALKPIWSETLDVPENVLSLEKNIPVLNRAVLEFAGKSLDTRVRDGDCTHLPEECLKAAGAEKRGIYRWGRELGPREPWLPGDILQMERTSVESPGGSRTFEHHSAVVAEVRPGAVTVLHQNAYPKGKIVQRETWPLAGIRGYVAAYRPWNWPKETPYPPAYPVRWSPSLTLSDPKGKSPKQVDLLPLIDPQLDRVQGIWFFEKNGRLRSPCEFEARLQVPVSLPKSYVVRLAVERLQGKEQFGIGLVVGGRQTMISIDNSNSRFTGFHNLDGKPASANDSTKQGTFLPLNKLVSVECRVREDAVQLNVGNEKVIDWHGDATRLSVSPDWPVPSSEWLFISAYDSEFEIRSFTLEVVK
jgi:hypothetical protein